MVRVLRRLVLAAVLVAGVVLLVRRRASSAGYRPRPSPAIAPDAAWPPISVPPISVPPTPVPPTPVPPSLDPDWVAPTERQCPLSHPIKANSNSLIFHVPGGRFYDRTVPQRCYAEADAAIADGYRAAKA
jgi:hypothetical protein